MARKGQGFDPQCLALPRVVQASGSGEEQERENGGRAEYFPQEAGKAKRSRNGFQSRRKATRRGLSEVGDDDRTLLTGRYGGRGWGCLAVHRAGLDRQAGRRSRCPGRRGSGGLCKRRRRNRCRVARGSSGASPRGPSLMSSQAQVDFHSIGKAGRVGGVSGDWSLAWGVCPAPTVSRGMGLQRADLQGGQGDDRSCPGLERSDIPARIPCGEALATTPGRAPSVNPAATRA